MPEAGISKVTFTSNRYGSNDLNYQSQYNYTFEPNNRTGFFKKSDKPTNETPLNFLNFPKEMEAATRTAATTGFFFEQEIRSPSRIYEVGKFKEYRQLVGH